MGSGGIRELLVVSRGQIEITKVPFICPRDEQRAVWLLHRRGQYVTTSVKTDEEAKGQAGRTDGNNTPRPIICYRYYRPASRLAHLIRAVKRWYLEQRCHVLIMRNINLLR